MARELFIRNVCTRLLVATATLASVAVVLPGAALTATAAERRACPFEAVVTADVAEVYSKHGVGGYVTGRLRQGQKVTVHRQDPGGWYMIIPPKGSFSWVPARLIKREGNLGVATANGVPVRVGTVDSDEHSVEHRRLSIDDQVTILGEKYLSVSPTDVAENWYKIEPPAREWRWIKGRDVTAVDVAATAPAATAMPQAVVTPIPAEKTAFDKPAPKKKEAPALRKNTPVEEAAEPVAEGEMPIEEPKGYLVELDAEFQRITSLDKSQWDFTELEEMYRDARSKARNPVTQQVIDRRLSSIRDYSREANVYKVLFSLTDENRQRDAELAARQAELEARLANSQQVIAQRIPSPVSMSGQPTPIQPGSQPQPIPAQATDPQMREPQLATSIPVNGAPSPLQPGPQYPRLAAPQFDGPTETATSIQPTARPTSVQPLGSRPVPQLTSIESRLGHHHPVPQTVRPSPFPSSVQPSPAMAAGQPRMVQSPIPHGQYPGQRMMMTSRPTSMSPTSMSPIQRLSPRFDGAGIVQAAPPGAPAPYVLTARDGRVLAFLAPQAGVNLNAWVGRPAGIHGARSHRAEIRADEIKVTGLEPVRLQ